MLEEKRSRKEWIKTIAIIFLSIMLVLTFFANTIRNYSLPEVATQYVYSDTLTTKIRGNGTVEAADPYNVVLKQSRKVASVKVRVGDEVQKGDVIYELEATESEELKKAQQELDALRAAYDKSLITGQVSTSDRRAVEGGNIGTTDQNMAKIDSAQRKVDNYEKEITNLEAELNRWKYNTKGDIPEAQAVKDAEKEITAWTIEQKARTDALDAAERDLKYAVEKFDEYEDVSDGDASKEAARQAVEAAKAKVTEKQNMLSIATDKLSSLNYIKSANKQTIDNRIAELEQQIELAKTNKTAAEESLKELVETITTRMDLNTSLNEIREKEKEVEQLKSEQTGNEVKAEVSGTILSLSRVAGETTSAEETVATIQLAGKAFTLSMSLTKDQAAMINKGDEAEVTNSWYYDDVHAIVSSIRPDKDSQGKKMIVTFEVQGESVTGGINLSLTITSRKSSNYDYVVPNSAIRHDNKGDYVYRLVEKSSPLGSRYSVERVDVTVLAEDETKSAVNGAFDGWNNYVVTTASKPLSDGTLVRLKQ